MRVWHGFPISEKSDVSDAQWSCLSFLGTGISRYSHDLKAKNIPRPVSCFIALSVLDICAFAREEMTDIGIAFWCFSSGSLFLNACSSHCRRNLTFSLSSRARLGQLYLQKVAQTCEMAPQTDL